MNRRTAWKQQLQHHAAGKYIFYSVYVIGYLSSWEGELVFSVVRIHAPGEGGLEFAYYNERNVL